MNSEEGTQKGAHTERIQRRGANEGTGSGEGGPSPGPLTKKTGQSQILALTVSEGLPKPRDSDPKFVIFMEEGPLSCQV